MKEVFRKFASKVSDIAGSAWAFMGALLVIFMWAASGPLFGFSDTWQLVINTSTTIVTFLMVFLIQNTQNRDAEATQLKLDELIHAITTASDEMIDLEEMSDEQLERLEKKYREMRRGREKEKGASSTRRSSGRSQTKNKVTKRSQASHRGKGE